MVNICNVKLLYLSLHFNAMNGHVSVCTLKLQRRIKGHRITTLVKDCFYSLFWLFLIV